MAGKIFLLFLTVLVFYGVECKSPPKVDGSYIAWGEIVQPIPDISKIPGTEGLTLQMNFEESYEATSKNAAFFVWLGGQNMTFIKNHKTNQTLLYVETKTETETESEEKEIKCMETSETEWAESDFEASLLSFEDDEGRIKFSLKQLFGLPEKYLSEKFQGVSTVYRGIPASSWTYEIKTKDKESGNDTTLSITSFWSNGTYSTSAGKGIVPLGFNVSKLIWSEPVVVEDYAINVFGYVPDAYDHKYFKPIEGVVCANRVKTLRFPDVKNLRAISLHSEVAMPDYQEIRYTDTWFDPINQLVRVDVERMKDEDPLERSSKRYQSEISIGKMGIVYRFGYYKGEGGCEIIPFSKYENDLQNLFDIKQSLTRWKMGKLFGLNDTSYTYIGKTTKNDVPCHMFQGIRSDWPDQSYGFNSLWEWCFNVNMTIASDIMMFDDDEFGLISAQITVLSAKNKNWVGFRMNHHFYEVKEQDPKILDATSFDIGRCYSDLKKKGLQFYLDVPLDYDNKTLAENATSDINFLQKWKAVLYTFSKLPAYSLRISSVRSTVDDNKMYVGFYILDIHDDIPKDLKDGMISASEAEKNLRDIINAGGLSIAHEWKKGEIFTFKAVPNSMSYQLDPNFNPQTVPPLPSLTPTEFTLLPFTLETESPLTRKVKYIGNQPGTVAAVSIAMLLVGISIGSGATFYKYNGLPSCLRR